MNILLYVAVLLLLFITPTTSKYLGIIQVGVFSSSLMILLFILNYFKRRESLFVRKAYANDLLLLTSVVFIMLYKVVAGDFVSVQAAFFFMMVPVFSFITIDCQHKAIKRNVKKILIAFFILECLMAFYERINQVNIFPYLDQDNLDLTLLTQESWEFRSSAFLGHPLMNSVCISTMMGFIMFLDIKGKIKAILIAMGFVSILCFNARGASLIWLIILAGYFLFYLKTSKNKLIPLLLISASTAVACFLLFYSSLGGRVVNGNKLIDGSAVTRIDVYSAFSYVASSDILWGNSENYKRVTLALNAGGVENSYIALILNFGLVGCIPLFYFLYKKVRFLLTPFKRSKKIVLLMSFILVGSLNNSLASGTPWLVFFLCCASFPDRDYKKIERVHQ